MFLDEENLIKFLIGFIIVLIFVFILTIFSMYFSFERESIMCPYCQQIYKIKYATEVGRAPVNSVRPAPVILPPVIRK